MLKSKRFYKKNKRGRVQTVNREHYLRDDIWCEVQFCQRCHHDTPVLQAGDVLVPDTNVLLHQIDLFEHGTVVNAVILSTVLNEVKHRSLPAYNRLRDMTANPKKRFAVFSNEHCRETFIEQEQGESPNDRNDRAIRVAARWYLDHVKSTDDGSDINVILLTDDADNRRKAKELGLVAMSVPQFAKMKSKETPEMLDLVATTQNGDEDSSSNAAADNIFEAHQPLSQMQAAIKAGKLYQGPFHVRRENTTEAYVHANGLGKSILIKGVNMNRALHKDIVAVELFPESEWSCESEIVEDKEARTLLEGGRADDDPEVPHLKVPTGKVVGIIRRTPRQYCGTILPDDDKAESDKKAAHAAKLVLVVPQNKIIPRLHIKTHQAANLLGKRIVVAIDSWARDSQLPVGHFVRTIGTAGDVGIETEVLLLEHDVPFEAFSEAILSELPEVPWSVSQEEYAKRRDLRDYNICSIDPPGCTDIDDALHCRQLEDGIFEVGVHIADVTHFIRPGSKIDAEASKRGTTVYLTNRRIDMVPGLLSSNLCSLRGGEERLAFSCIWKMNADAEIIGVEFTKSVIKSKLAMMYSEAQLRIDDAADKSDLTRSLRQLNTLAKKLKQKRLENGALFLASPEIRFQAESESHDPVDVAVKQIYDTNSLVEEFMLLANVTVAQQIYNQFPACAVLRRHPTPPDTNFEPLLKAAKSAGIELNTASSRDLALSLDNTRHTLGDGYINTLLRIMATRCMLQAVYFSSGSVNEADFLHYGLASPIYTHFTSPIRRYSDVLVHRLLAASIGADEIFSGLLDKDKIQRICDNLNHRHRMAQHAARASTELHSQLFFKNKTLVEEAYIVRVRKNAIQVLVPRFGLEGPVFLKGAGVQLDFDAETQRLAATVDSQTVNFSVFDKIQVQIQVESTDFMEEKVILQLVTPSLEGVSVAPIDFGETATDGQAVDESTGINSDSDQGKKRKKSVTDDSTPVQTKKKKKKKKKKGN